MPDVGFVVGRPIEFSAESELVLPTFKKDCISI
jgi:hypothetical protein